MDLDWKPRSVYHSPAFGLVTLSLIFLISKMGIPTWLAHAEKWLDNVYPGKFLVWRAAALAGLTHAWVSCAVCHFLTTQIPSSSRTREPAQCSSGDEQRHETLSWGSCLELAQALHLVLLVKTGHGAEPRSNECGNRLRLFSENFRIVWQRTCIPWGVKDWGSAELL